ncbi:tail fiber domain-containing protein [Spartinivicinus poritis]|uniref:Tail fiber domain-containing protein n=1 Tax=Spartinivicinus poritis TaxID=2994640 RepID=A0ABT5UI63_9GAMM|nr:tail fiber domain-containing protein [Spartinivicinus sp. A2-2]MDE1466055.1 tail fiber domain-containing protein [Spartinivicinus sp. A2-2]
MFKKIALLIFIGLLFSNYASAGRICSKYDNAKCTKNYWRSPARFSDENLKTNIQLLPSSLAKLTQIKGVSYTFEPTNTEEYGVIAQDIQQVFPELVTTHESGYLQVNYTGLIPVLVEAVKELKQEVEDLKREREI